MSGRAPRVLVVSQPNTVPHNQLVYLRLRELGWDVAYIVPARWRDDYTDGTFAPRPVAGLEGTFARVRVVNPGPPQRHFYATRPSRWLRHLRPDAVFLEQEPFALSTAQWGPVCRRLEIPWGIQGDENLDRPFPWPARVIRRWSVPRAQFFAARSPAAGRMLERWGARAPVGVVPHTIPEWPPAPRPAAAGPFTVGFAGRLVPAKGIGDLVEAVRRVPFPVRLLVVGNGPLRAELEAADLGGGALELRTGVLTDDMPGLYREMDVLVLPSRTTETWAEQFGKVLCEALLCGTPVVGSSSGEIPWVIETTGGGRVFPEGNAGALAAVLAELRERPELRAQLAARGRAGVAAHFAPRVAARSLDGLLRGALAAAERRRGDAAVGPP